MVEMKRTCTFLRFSSKMVPVRARLFSLEFLHVQRALKTEHAVRIFDYISLDPDIDLRFHSYPSKQGAVSHCSINFYFCSHAVFSTYFVFAFNLHLGRQKKLQIKLLVGEVFRIELWRPWT